MPNPILTQAIDTLASRSDLSEAQAAEVLAQIMHGEVSETQIAGFLIALRTKGETVQELAGMARTMRELAAHVPSDAGEPARHGGHRRGATHVQRLHHRRADRRGRGLRGGQARQPLRHRPLRVGRPAGGAGRAHRPRPRGGGALHRGGRVWLHVRACPPPATRFVVPVRHELGVRTIFNLLGPLTNPAGASRQLIGVSDAVLPGDDRRRARAAGRSSARWWCAARTGWMRSRPRLATTVVEVDGDEIRRYTLAPAGIRHRASGTDHPELAGGTPEQNATVTRAIFEGEVGPAR